MVTRTHPPNSRAGIKHRVRLENLRRLIIEAGSGMELARRVNTSHAYLSQLNQQWRTKAGMPRTLGDGLAERLERVMEKPPGWMDVDRGPCTGYVPASADPRGQPARGAGLPLVLDTIALPELLGRIGLALTRSSPVNIAQALELLGLGPNGEWLQPSRGSDRRNDDRGPPEGMANRRERRERAADQSTRSDCRDIHPRERAMTP